MNHQLQVKRKAFSQSDSTPVLRQSPHHPHTTESYLLQPRREHAAPGYNLATIAINRPDTPPPQSIRPKLTIGQEAENQETFIDQNFPPPLQRQALSMGRMPMSESLVQPKLTIGQPGDKYEQEADRVATQVVNQINAPAPQQLTQSQPGQRQEKLEAHKELQMKPTVQLQASGGGLAATEELESSIQQARGGGQPLADNVRKPMEQAFGADFSRVKVHTDAQADQLNQSIQAKAFTTGQDVFFRQGEYNPGSRGGQELIAHELTHVVQQNFTGISSQDSRDLRTKLMNQSAQSSTIQTYLSKSTNNFTVIQKTHTAQLGGNRARKIDQLGQSQLQDIWDKKDVLMSQRQIQDREIVLNPDESAGGIEGLFEAVKTRLDLLNQKTKPFNVRGRALDTPKTGILITEDQALARIAWKAEVQVVKPQMLTDPNTEGTIKNHIQQHELKLIKEGPGYKYYANSYGIRIPREDASLKTGENLPRGNHNQEYTTPVHTLNKPAQRGDESVGRDSAMGGFTARNYAIAAGAPREVVENTQWEWLHLIAASLGGNNEVGNLVAGTFDGNTRMIPWERKIVQLSQKINEKDLKTYIRVYAKCTTSGNTWLAFTVQLLAENSDGQVVLQSPQIDVYEGIVMDKLEYDLDSYMVVL